MKMTRQIAFLLIILSAFATTDIAPAATIWQIGKADNSAAEFALAPNQYAQFIENDFGWEDRFYLIGSSSEKEDWPYVLPGPSDKWGGTWGTSGWRSHTLNILFDLKEAPEDGEWKLVVDIHDIHPTDAPVFKVTINGKSWKYALPGGSGNKTLEGESTDGKEYIVELPVPAGLLRRGGNQITMTSIQGSWLMFDQIRLEGPETAALDEIGDVFLRDVSPADYEVKNGESGGKAQPLLVDVEHLSGTPELKVLLDGKAIFTAAVEAGRYVFEAPMPAVAAPRTSRYRILVDGKDVQSGEVLRAPHKEITPAEYADTMMGTAHSRWMIAPGPWMPFSMVKLSPDNQNGGWQAGYDPIFESIGGFSHIHEWTMSGLSLMPTNGELITRVGDEKHPDEGYRSRLNKETEQAPIGYYRAELTDYGITAELTATTRAGFQRYTFPKNRPGSRVLIDLQNPAEYGYKLEEVTIKKVSDTLEKCRPPRRSVFVVC